jgi:hypothetical protein
MVVREGGERARRLPGEGLHVRRHLLGGARAKLREDRDQPKNASASA